MDYLGFFVLKVVLSNVLVDYGFDEFRGVLDFIRGYDEDNVKYNVDDFVI